MENVTWMHDKTETREVEIEGIKVKAVIRYGYAEEEESYDFYIGDDEESQMFAAQDREAFERGDLINLCLFVRAEIDGKVTHTETLGHCLMSNVADLEGNIIREMSTYDMADEALFMATDDLKNQIKQYAKFFAKR